MYFSAKGFEKFHGEMCQIRGLRYARKNTRGKNHQPLVKVITALYYRVVALVLEFPLNWLLITCLKSQLQERCVC